MPSAQLAAAKGQNSSLFEFQLFKLREQEQLNCINKFTCYKFVQLETSHICMSLEIKNKIKKRIHKPYAVVTSLQCKLITSLDAIP